MSFAGKGLLTVSVRFSTYIPCRMPGCFHSRRTSARERTIQIQHHTQCRALAVTAARQVKTCVLCMFISLQHGRDAGISICRRVPEAASYGHLPTEAMQGPQTDP